MSRPYVSKTGPDLAALAAAGDAAAVEEIATRKAGRERRAAERAGLSQTGTSEGAPAERGTPSTRKTDLDFVAVLREALARIGQLEDHLAQQAAQIEGLQIQMALLLEDEIEDEDEDEGEAVDGSEGDYRKA